ncbi:MAG TPA: HAD family hydrolase [Acidobacteriaceae bacterium]|nr:HAD family hydrolase [Acidobacteriaceae bacterium]
MGVRQKALFLDRDGVINHEVGYLHTVEEVRWVEGIFELCRVAVGLGYKLVVVTNQAGIARGMYTEAQYEALMQWMLVEFVKQGVALDAVYFCPFHPEGVGKYKREHDDRKPGTGMLRRAAKELGVELGASVMVGDRCTDVMAANAAGLRTAFLLEGTEKAGCGGEYKLVQTLHQVQEWLVVAAAASADEVAHGEADVDGALDSLGE